MFSVISLILVTIATIYGIVATVKFVIAARKTNYEGLLIAQRLLGIGTVLLGIRVALNIAVFSEERIAYAMIGFILSVFAYVLWKFLLIPQFKRFAVPDTAAIERQEIMDELNDQYLHPEKFLNKDR